MLRTVGLLSMLSMLSMVVVGCGRLPFEDDADADAGVPLDTVLSVEGFDRSCRVDADCVAGLVGDICACGCAWAGISASARAAYDQAALRTAMACEAIPECPDCVLPFIWCDAGTCRARGEAGPCGCPTGTVCVQRFDATCGGGTPECVAAPPGCAADPSVPAGRRICDAECADAVCGVGSGCEPAGGVCGDRGAQPERPPAVHCYGF